MGIECEPNLVFAECNQHPVLGLMNYDQVHGTKLADVREAFWAKAISLGFLDTKKTQRFTGPYLIKEAALMSMQTGWNDGWTGVTLHGWNKDLVKQVYPVQRDAALPELVNTDRDAFKNRWAQSSVSTDFGFLAAYAAEVGDKSTAERLLAFADAQFKPAWKDRRYVYPLHDVPVPGAPQVVSGIPGEGPRGPAKPLLDEQVGQYQVGPLNANALLAFARLDPGEGLWKLNNDLASTYVVNGPEIVGVEYPKVLVTQAYFDKARGVLAVAVEPGPGSGGDVSFGVRNLRKGGAYTVLLDGEPAATITGREARVIQSGLAVSWTKAGELSLAFPLGQGRGIKISGVGGRQVAAR